MPPFLENEPELWFHTVEAVFSVNGFTSNAIKFGKVLSVLDCTLVKENANIFTLCSEADLYEKKLKNQLVEDYKLSEE